jgi:hypothetical protein
MPTVSAAAYVPSFIFSVARNLTRAARNVGGGQRPAQYRRFYDGEGGRTESVVSRLFKRFGITKLAAVPAGLTVISQSATQASSMAQQERRIPDASSNSAAPQASTSSEKSPELAKTESVAPAMHSAIPPASTSSEKPPAPTKTVFVAPAVHATAFVKPDKTMPLIRSNAPVMLAAIKQRRDNAKHAGADSAPAPVPLRNQSSWLVRTTLVPRALGRAAAAKTD